MALLINFSVLLLPSFAHSHFLDIKGTTEYLQFGLMECKENFRLIRDILGMAFLKLSLFFGTKLKWLVFDVSLFLKGKWDALKFWKVIFS